MRGSSRLFKGRISIRIFKYQDADSNDVGKILSAVHNALQRALMSATYLEMDSEYLSIPFERLRDLIFFN